MRDQSEQRGTLRYFLRRQALRPLPPYGRHGRIYLWRPLAIAGLIALVIGLGAGTSYAFVTKGRSETATAAFDGGVTQADHTCHRRHPDVAPPARAHRRCGFQHHQPEPLPGIADRGGADRWRPDDDGWRSGMYD